MHQTLLDTWILAIDILHHLSWDFLFFLKYGETEKISVDCSEGTAQHTSYVKK